MNSKAIYYSQKVEDIINGIDDGDFNQKIIPEKYTWEHMLALLLLKDSLDGGNELYEFLYDKVISSGVYALKTKAHNNEIINIYFQSYSAAQWPAETVYRRFEKIHNTDVKVIVSPLADRDKESCIDTYTQTLKWFEKNGTKVACGLDTDTMEYKSWDSLGIPDILYIVSAWYNSLPECQQFIKLPLRCLVAYIPYCMCVADTQGGDYSKLAVYNKEVVNLMWKVYCDSVSAYRGYAEYQFLKARNVVYSGYAKMDYFSDEKNFKDMDLRTIWKMPGTSSGDFKKVIIAPHYSIFNHSVLSYSTFHNNVWFLLYIAQKYENISFIFKPHPNLRKAAVQGGLFGSYKEYDSYLARWNSLPNAKVVQEASYLEYFATSDAMIMDSGSFLGEYLYTGKPLLYLTREGQAFTEIGDRIVDVYYKSPGEDYRKIEEFLNKVVLEEKDPMMSKRQEIFIREFDYKRLNGKTATDVICDDVLIIIDDNYSDIQE